MPRGCLTIFTLRDATIPLVRGESKLRKGHAVCTPLQNTDGVILEGEGVGGGMDIVQIPLPGGFVREPFSGLMLLCILMISVEFYSG